MKVFLLLLLFTLAIKDAHAQTDVVFIKAGYINQGGPKGFQLGINISKDHFLATNGFSIATSGLWQDGKFFISPRAGYEMQFTFLAAAAEVSYLRENLYVVPQIGFTFLSYYDLLFGYNARIAGDNHQTQVNGLFFSTTININLSKRDSGKIGG